MKKTFNRSFFISEKFSEILIPPYLSKIYMLHPKKF
jgi:hypothetical protein